MAVKLSFHLNLFGLLDQGVQLEITDTKAVGELTKDFGVDGHLKFLFDINYKRPWVILFTLSFIFSPQMCNFFFYRRGST